MKGYRQYINFKKEDKDMKKSSYVYSGSMESTAKYFEKLTKEGNTITSMEYVKGVYGEDLLKISYEWTIDEDED